MTPHLFKSCLIKGKWACCAKTLNDDPLIGRAYKPLPAAAITYGRTPLEAYKEWMKYFAPAKEATNVGSARS